MGRIHLCRQKYPESWFVLEEGVDYIGAMHQGKVSIMNVEDVMRAETLSQLLHHIQGMKDFKWLVEMDYLDSRNKTRSVEYPHHRELHVLAGYVPSVCDIQIERECYLAKWKVRYISELWIQTNDYMIQKVDGINSIAKVDVDRFISYWNLHFEEGEHGLEPDRGWIAKGRSTADCNSEKTT